MTFHKTTYYIITLVVIIMVFLSMIIYHHHSNTNDEIIIQNDKSINACDHVNTTPIKLPIKNIILKSTNNDNISFTVEIANTPDSRQIGLMCRETLKIEQGMLFIFNDSKIRSFWMKNTLIPLDIIFIDENLNIINIHKNTTPLLENIVYKSDLPAKYVLELNGGVADAYNLDSSTKLIIN